MRGCVDQRCGNGVAVNIAVAGEDPRSGNGQRGVLGGAIRVTSRGRRVVDSSDRDGHRGRGVAAMSIVDRVSKTVGTVVVGVG